MNDTKDTTGLAAFNAVRSALAAERNVARAGDALEWLEYHPPGSPMVDRYRQAVRARMMWPGLTLAEIAEKYHLTKDTYSARLRRGIELAERAELAAL